MAVPDFDTVADALALAGAPGEPAELHGQLCGLACLMGHDAGQPWLAEILAGAASGGDARALAEQTLSGLAWETLQAMEEGNMELALMLPDDAQPLAERADGLGLWCQGFLHGLGAGSASETIMSQGVTGEVVRDFSEISRAGFGEDQDAQEAEAAFVELVEFVRVSTQLVFEELHGLRNGPESTDH